MFLHLGADTVIPLENVIAIFDIKSDRAANGNKKFLQNRIAEKKVIDVSEGNPKSCVIADQEIYLSAISSLTLKKRAGQRWDKI
jgi:extracellular matrix regulatory protein B